MNTKNLIIWSVAFATLFYISCSKNSDFNDENEARIIERQRAENAWKYKNSNCDACDEFKKSLSTNPNFKDLFNNFDSLYYCLPCQNNTIDCKSGYICFQNSSYNPQTIGNINNVDGGIILYDKYRLQANAISYINFLRTNFTTLYSKYGKYIYYTTNLIDTPWIVPMWIGFKFDENKGSTVGPMSFIQNTPYLDEDRKYKSNSATPNTAGQVGDTIYQQVFDRYITFKNQYTVKYNCYYFLTLSSDRETMNMKVDFYDIKKGENPFYTKPSKTINHILKKYQP